MALAAHIESLALMADSTQEWRTVPELLNYALTVETALDSPEITAAYKRLALPVPRSPLREAFLQETKRAFEEAQLRQPHQWLRR